jgi:glycine/D-amino acid oxidase-like deaminating enzyme
MARYKYLIVGQGLAGTVLSFQLHQAGIAHMVVDNGHHSASTLAAAGIINPITGRRYVKSWMIDELLPVALDTYAALEELLEITLVTRSPIIRTFENQAQENLWNESTSRPGYGDYVGGGQNPYVHHTHPSYGYGVINQACQVQVGQLIISYREFLIQQGRLITQDFNPEDLQYDGPVQTVEDHTFEQVIFCEGYKAIHNPLFRDLPFQPAKGESLIIETDILLPQAMLRDTVFVAPASKQTFWSGGGYAWDKLDEKPTEDFRLQWMDKLQAIWKGELKVVSHKAGVRPSVKGRRPLIGRHSSYHRMILFNGMGTKGTSLAPYWAKHLIDHLESDTDLSQEVSLNRF